MRNKNYYVGYYSALQIHKLITQPSITEIIVTDVQIKPSNIEIQGVRFQFVYHNKNRFFGIQNSWIDDFNRVKSSDLEKTLVDSFIHPQYSNGMIEIAKAVYESRNKINQSKIMDYFTRSENKVAARRYAFICDLLEIGSSYHESLLQNNLSGSFLLLDTSAPDEGKINTRYELKINRDINTIKEAIYT
jgi:predicted transcriptional regulator of viral defense system